MGLARGKRCLCFCSRFPCSHHEERGGLPGGWGRGAHSSQCAAPQTELCPPRSEPPGTACCLRGWYGVWGCCGHGVRGWGGTVHRGCFGGWWVAPWGQSKGQCSWKWQVLDLSPWVVAGHRAGGAHMCAWGCAWQGVCVLTGACVPKCAQACPSVRECPCSLLQQRNRAGHGTLDARVPVPEPLCDPEQAVFLPAHPACASVSPRKSSPLPVSGEPEVLASCWGDAGVSEYPRCVCLLLLLCRG